MSLKIFQRTKFRAYVKLGARQKSKRRYKKATGRHNKTRQGWKSRPPKVEIGYKREVAKSGLINNKIPIVINNLSDFNKVKKGMILIIGKVGNKKRIEMLKEAEKRKLEVANFNIKKKIRSIEREMTHRKKIKAEKKSKKKSNLTKKEEKKKAEKKKEGDKAEENKEDKAKTENQGDKK